jgi:hypothetical protein
VLIDGGPLNQVENRVVCVLPIVGSLKVPRDIFISSGAVEPRATNSFNARQLVALPGHKHYSMSR